MGRFWKQLLGLDAGATLTPPEYFSLMPPLETPRLLLRQVKRRDATDYLLPVRRGERLYLILALQHGCFVKKDSIAGWYRGRYNMITEVDEP